MALAGFPEDKKRYLEFRKPIRINMMVLFWKTALDK